MDGFRSRFYRADRRIYELKYRSDRYSRMKQIEVEEHKRHKGYRERIGHRII